MTASESQVESRDSALHMGDNGSLFRKSKELIVRSRSVCAIFLSLDMAWRARLLQVPADIVAMLKIFWRLKPVSSLRLV